MQTRSTLSVIIITKNEAANIRKCLESVKWADEIIILDSGSTDETVKICQEYTKNVFITDWPGFGPQKNRALQKATKDWALNIDADEWLSDELSQEIQKILSKEKHGCVGYQMLRRWIICGQQLKHGDMGSNYVPRLFLRSQVEFSNVLVHEGLVIKGSVKKFKKIRALLYHQSYHSIAQSIDKMNLYTSLAAQMKRQHGKQASLFKAIFHGMWMFSRSYFFRLGFLDGKIGFFSAFLFAEHSFYKYAKLWDPPAEQTAIETVTNPSHSADISIN